MMVIADDFVGVVQVERNKVFLYFNAFEDSFLEELVHIVGAADLPEEIGVLVEGDFDFSNPELGVQLINLAFQILPGVLVKDHLWLKGGLLVEHGYLRFRTMMSVGTLE
jgi:hypothetical protein